MRKFCYTHRVKKAGVIVWALLSLLAGPVFRLEGAFFSSQERHTKGPDLWKSGAGVRPLALGGAGVALAEDPSAIGWNAGALNLIPLSEFLFQRDSGFDGQSRHFASYVRPFWSDRGRRTWGFQAAVKQEPDFELVDNGETIGEVKPLDLSLALAYARPWGLGHAGTSLKGYIGRTFQHEAHALALDAGYYRSVNDQRRWGLSVSNLGVSFPKEDPSLPLTVRLGGVQSLWAQNRGRWDLVGEVDLPSGSPPVFHGGTEYSGRIGDNYRGALRWGYRSGIGDRALDGMTAGFGLDRGSLRLNYALAFTESLGAMHRFEIGWRTGEPLAMEARQNELWRNVRDDIDNNRWMSARENLGLLEKASPRFAPARPLRRLVESRLRDILDPETLYQIGLSYLQKKDYEKAVDYFEKLLLSKPDHAEGRAALEKAKALATPRAPKEGVKKDKPRDSERPVRRALDEGKWESALEASRGLNLRPGEDLFEELNGARQRVFTEGVRQEERGAVDEAIRIFEFLQSLGGEGDSAHRLEVLRQARENLKAARSAALYQEGVKAYAAGEAEKARRLFQEALSLTPNDMALRRALERLDAERKR